MAPPPAGSARSACPRPGPARWRTGGLWPAGRGRAPRGHSVGSPDWVHVTARLGEPLVPDAPAGTGGPDGSGTGWPEPLDGRPGGAPWTVATRSMPHSSAPGAPNATFIGVAGGTVGGGAAGVAPLDVPWTERGVVVCGDGDYDAALLLRLPEEAGWPVLAEPPSGARRGPNALSAYPYLLDMPEFLAGHRPDLIVSAGRPGLSRGQTAFLGGAV